MLLYCSKTLDLKWLPESPLWHDPMLLRVDETSAPPGYRWYWRVGIKLVAWAVRAAGRAAKNGCSLPPSEVHALEALECYLLTENKGCWPEVLRLSEAGPVHLDNAVIGFAREL